MNQLELAKEYVQRNPYSTAGVAATAIFGLLAIKLFRGSAAPDHCKECITGYLVKGVPKGQISKLGGVETYISRPEVNNPKSCIIILTDIFGMTFINSQLIADEFTKQTGFLCVIPDLFNGNPLPPNKLDSVLNDPPEDAGIFGRAFHSLQTAFAIVGVIPWFLRTGSGLTKYPIVESVIQELKEKHDIKKIGVIGYCYGGPLSVEFAAKPDKIDAYGVVHPGRLQIPAAIEAIQKPGLWLCAGTDRSFGDAERIKTEEILKKKGLKAIFKVYPGTGHGFAIRGNESKEVVRVAKQAAVEEAIQFFKDELAN